MHALTLFSAIFQLYRGDLFYWWRKQEYLEKTTDMPRVSCLYSSVAPAFITVVVFVGFVLHNLITASNITPFVFSDFFLMEK
jgi:hypothetical protein